MGLTLAFDHCSEREGEPFTAIVGTCRTAWSSVRECLVSVNTHLSCRDSL